MPRSFARSPRATGQAGRVLLRCGAFDEGEAVLGEAAERGDGDAAQWRAEVRLWRGDLGGAERWAEQLPDSAARLRILSVIAGQRGHGASAGLDEAARGGDPEARRWQAEIALRAGRPADAEALLAEAWAQRFDFTTQLLLVGIAAAAPGRWERLVTAHPMPFDGFLDEVAPGLPGGAALERTDGRAVLAWVLDLLDSLGANRSELPTLAESGDLRLLTVPPTSRSVAAGALDRLADGGPEAALGALARAQARHPRSPHPWTYRGELLLWMGRTDEAAQALRGAQERARCRWGWVGLSAAAGLRGFDRSAERAALWSLRDFGALAGSTLGGYRGERLVAQGRSGEARRELQAAVDARPARIGAWLALAQLEAGGEALRQLEARAPALMFEARVRAGDPAREAVLRAARDLLAGNRASRMLTIARGPDGLRVLPPPAPWQRLAAQLRRWLARR